ncbi:hypothetical protein [Gimesia aquarii]|uniref:hypothetical protein n=1 Tax=Gimesia aquarii TaxID=2527964 RepID=UPI0011A27768|nr:hypothetical protein [Gimesia aquarii]
MSYRRNGKKMHEWYKWLQERKSLVATAGLPADVAESEDTFGYFVDHSYNQAGWLGKAMWFSVDDLNSEQRAALWSLIVQAYETLWSNCSDLNLEKTLGLDEGETERRSHYPDTESTNHTVDK